MKWFVQLALYLATILGVTYASSGKSERSLYDTTRVAAAGVRFPVMSVDRALQFYRDVLDFEPFIETVENQTRLGVVLPGGERISFISGGEGRAATVVLKVYNSFDRLHNELRRRSDAHQLSAISPIKTSGRIRQFTATDPDGNNVVFYSGRGRRVL